jgi:uncharacterized protein (TIGR02452 family)
LDYAKNQAIAKENHEILRKGLYETVDGKAWSFRHPLAELQQAEVSLPGNLEILAEEVKKRPRTGKGIISVVEGDTMDHAGEGVLNFANAYEPGGGYLWGAVSQEECLCRESTLYASLASREGSKLYAYNRSLSGLESDGMIYSPHVEIFRKSRDEDYALFGPPRETSVITLAAPDLRGPANRLAPYEIRTIRLRRIRYTLSLFASKGCRTITLGAWGCGVFGHDPYDVADDFHTVLMYEDMRNLFDEIIFAVWCGEDKRNFVEFKEMFGK